MIIHSPIISGSLTFADGATFTLPDGGEYSGSFSGSIQVDKVKSSLIPDSSASYDLGSADFPFKDLYLSSGTGFIGGIGLSALPGVGLNIFNKSDNSGAGLALASLNLGGVGGVGGKNFDLDDNGDLNITDDATGDGINIVVGGLLISSSNGAVTMSIDENGNLGTTNVEGQGSSNLSGSFTGSIQDLVANGDATFNNNVDIVDTLTFGQVSQSLSIVSGAIEINRGAIVFNNKNVAWVNPWDGSSEGDYGIFVRNAASGDDSATGSLTELYDKYSGFRAFKTSTADTPNYGEYAAGQFVGSGGFVTMTNGSGSTVSQTSTNFSYLGQSYYGSQFSVDLDTGSAVFINGVTEVATAGLGHIIPAEHNTYDLGSVDKYWRDLYLSSGSLYINGTQVLSTDGTELTIQTDAGESIKLLETGADTITLQTANGDITLTATGTGNIELDAPIQIAAGKNILSSDGNAITFANDVNLGSNDIFAANLVGVVSGSQQVIDLLPAGTVSGSVQVLGGTGIVSSSAIAYSGNDVTILGNLTVQGTQTQLNTTALNIEDINILIASGAANSAAADGAGITIDGANVTFTWDSIASRMDLNSDLEITGGDLYVDTIHGVAGADVAIDSSHTLSVAAEKLKIGGTPVTSTAAELNLVDGSSAGTVVNSKAVIYGASGEVNASKLQVGGVDITSTPAELNLLDGVSGLVKADFTKLAAVDATATELNYVSGVTSAIQTQLDNITGTDIGVTLTGAVTGTGTITNLGNVSIATTATSDPTLTIDGDASGTATFTNLGNATLTLTIADDSHNHTIANVDGLQTALDGKLATTHDFSITLTGDVTGTGTVTNMGNVSFSTTIADDSHNHIISNIDGLQSALDAKQATISGGTGVTVSSNTVSIGQAVATNSNVTFATVSATGDIVAYASSDERLKDNIEVISNPIEKVQQLKGVTWDWNDNADELQKSLPNVGVIAQDVEKVLPQLVKDRDNGYKGVDYDKIVGLLIEAIKDQQTQIDELKSKLS